MLYQTFNYINEGYDPEIILINIYEMKMLHVFRDLSSTESMCDLWGNGGGFFFFDSEGGLYATDVLRRIRIILNYHRQQLNCCEFFIILIFIRLGNISVKHRNKARLKQVIDTIMKNIPGLFLKTKKFLDQWINLKETFDPLLTSVFVFDMILLVNKLNIAVMERST